MPSLFCLLAALALSACSANEPADAPPLQVLFVGNSLTYTNNLPAVVEALGRQPGAQVIRSGMVAYPNFSLADHLTQGDAVTEIQSGRWSVVVLQQGPSGLPESRTELVASTRQYLTLTRPVHARIALLGVWPANDRLTAFDSVTASYSAAAQAVDGVLLPAGRGWTAAWQTQPSLALYGPDGFHPGPLGTLLAALVVYRGLTGRPLATLPPTMTIGGVPVRIPPDLAATLLQAAERAFQGCAGGC